MASTSTNMNTSEFKQLIKNKLNISDEQLTKLFKSTLYSFKSELEQIGGQTFIDSLMDLSYDKMIEYDEEEDDYNSTKTNENIYEKNCKDEKECFLCICGKQHLKNLHIFNHNKTDKCIVIGSSCITQVEKLKNVYSENQALANKLGQIITKLKDNEKLAKKMKTHKPCAKCGDLCINKKGGYKYPHMNNYCRTCLLGKDKCWIKCSQCCVKLVKPSQPMPFGEGFKKICGSCWHHNNKDKSWYKNKYKK